MTEKSVQVGFPCPSALKAALMAAADSEGVSLAAYVRGALEAHLARPRGGPVDEMIAGGARILKQGLERHGLAWW